MITHYAWEGKKMSNIKPDNIRRQAAEEEFFRLAAMEIESEQNEEFLEAQNLPDPAPEVLQRMQTHLQQTMRKTQKRKERRTIFLHFGRFTACAAIICCVLISGTYFSVDATRVSINNFIMEIFSDHAIVRTNASMKDEGAALPVNWEGPFYVTWVPSRFTYVAAKTLDSYWALTYRTESGENTFSIYVWDNIANPHINIEGFKLLSQEHIQGFPANIYSSLDSDSRLLIWINQNYIIQIGGDISSDEMIEVAKKITF